MAMQENNVIPLGARTVGGDRKKVQLLLDESRAITLRFLPTLLKRMLDNADDTLFELADKSESNLLQGSYFMAMRDLRLQRVALEKSFEQRITAAFNQFLSQPAAAEKPAVPSFGNADTMSLVDELDLEESLAVSAMVAKVKNRLARELYAIEHRFAAVAPANTVTLDTIPVGPKVICEAFRDSLKQFDSDAGIKLIVYKLFDKYVSANLAPLYDEINTLFADAGVLPSLRMTVKRQPGAAPTARANASEPPYTNTPTGQSLDNGAGYQQPVNGESLLGTLQQLLAQQRIPASAGPLPPLGGQGSGQHIDPVDLVNALSAIQMRDVRFESYESIDQLKAALSSEIRTTVSGGRLALLSPVDNDLIDIVAMLFDFILDDQSLPPVAKALLSRLQIPLLKVAISDKEFFSKKQHPARRLLNLMAQAAMGLDEELRIESSPLLQKIDYIVNRILNDYRDNTAIFDELLQEFERFQSLAQSQESRITVTSQKRYEAREKQKLTSAWVMECIASRLKEKSVPKPVYELIAGPWREVMTHTYLNEGDESIKWKEQLRFIDLLVWSVEPKRNDGEKKRLANILIELIITLQDGLKSIGTEAAEVEHLLTALESCHMASMRGEKPTAHGHSVRVKIDTTTVVDESTDEIGRALAEMQSQLNSMSKLEEMLNIPILGIDDVVESAPNLTAVGDDDDVEEITITSGQLHGKVEPVINDEYWQQTLDLKMGQWISLMDESGKRQRLRLVWKSDYLGEVTFSNWKFKVVAELSFNDMAARFRRGEAELLEALPLFERAVDAVMNRLHQHTVAAE